MISFFIFMIIDYKISIRSENSWSCGVFIVDSQGLLEPPLGETLKYSLQLNK